MPPSTHQPSLMFHRKRSPNHTRPTVSQTPASSPYMEYMLPGAISVSTASTTLHSTPQLHRDLPRRSDLSHWRAVSVHNVSFHRMGRRIIHRVRTSPGPESPSSHPPPADRLPAVLHRVNEFGVDFSFFEVTLSKGSRIVGNVRHSADPLLMQFKVPRHHVATCQNFKTFCRSLEPLQGRRQHRSSTDMVAHRTCSPRSKSIAVISVLFLALALLSTHAHVALCARVKHNVTLDGYIGSYYEDEDGDRFYPDFKNSANPTSPRAPYIPTLMWNVTGPGGKILRHTTWEILPDYAASASLQSSDEIAVYEVTVSLPHPEIMPDGSGTDLTHGAARRTSRAHFAARGGAGSINGALSGMGMYDVFGWNATAEVTRSGASLVFYIGDKPCGSALTEVSWVPGGCGGDICLRVGAESTCIVCEVTTMRAISDKFCWVFGPGVENGARDDAECVGGRQCEGCYVYADIT
ncbi:hypothetical protein M427DRAFT_143168 [Gonapodya prolifera JEL478]|uniref:Uncharacterized protein n=1 Tax=Gonapodya prolifera (strain JEL478) TaxID=1344416 RepID=A0A139AT91_GONPJ|nr:hypothetical protein M427DRAFT_143168 [Gonapodya prolifera JEL478]|eukprot:KXS19947.1 hypothetical protein M427DRAFT_143168 [Gonapodya prolifera JEL478]